MKAVNIPRPRYPDLRRGWPAMSIAVLPNLGRRWANSGQTNAHHPRLMSTRPSSACPQSATARPILYPALRQLRHVIDVRKFRRVAPASGNAPDDLSWRYSSHAACVLTLDFITKRSNSLNYAGLLCTTSREFLFAVTLPPRVLAWQIIEAAASELFSRVELIDTRGCLF